MKKMIERWYEKIENIDDAYRLYKQGIDVYMLPCNLDDFGSGTLVKIDPYALYWERYMTFDDVIKDFKDRHCYNDKVGREIEFYIEK